MCLRYRHATIFFVAFMGYMTVGVASTFFHASLKCECRPFDVCRRDLAEQWLTLLSLVDWMQLADELSMIYTTFFMMYATFSYGRPPIFRVLLSIGLAATAWYITVSGPPESCCHHAGGKTDIAK